jgi:hypothetical protein
MENKKFQSQKSKGDMKDSKEQQSMARLTESSQKLPAEINLPSGDKSPTPQSVYAGTSPGTAAHKDDDLDEDSEGVRASRTKKSRSESAAAV